MRIITTALVWAFCASAAWADEARVRAHAAAFVAAFNDGSLAAAERFVARHGVGDATRLAEVFARQRAAGGLLERAQVRLLPSGRFVFVIARRAETGAWENFQFQVDEANEDRLQLIFIAQALEPYALPEFGVEDARFPAWLDGFVANLRETQPFYGVIAIARGDDVVYQRAFGLADAGEQRPNTLDTRFGLASGGKMFTATAVMQLSERGTLSLSDPFTRFVPEAAASPGANAITIRHLLTHTSGIPDYWDDEYERDWANITGHEHLLRHVLRNFGTPQPGAYAYSNSNYALLGLIVERASGESFYDHLQRNIFEPARMSATGYPLRSEEGADYARPYNPVIESGLIAIGRHAAAELNARGSGAGGASSTAADMLAFDRALRSGALVRPETFAQMRSLQAASDLAGSGYGYGLIIQRGSYGHGGSAPGTQFEFRRYEEDDVTIVVMSNFNTIAGPEIASALDRVLTR
ncbi:MAG: serine hydrolase domain-containing protein [Hyphomonadaceae bacterium]